MNPPTLPHQASSPDGDAGPPLPAEDRRHVVRRRWITAIIILLLVGVPAGYLAVSAQQSRQSGRDKAAKVGASKVRPGWPSKVQRSIYEVPIPDKAWRVGFLETNNWRTSRLYTQFAVTPAALDVFLTSVGTSRDELTPGVSISEHDTSVAGWNWKTHTEWVGTTLEQADPRPSRDITVDLTDPKVYKVYVVSSTTP
uniref:Sugar kinase n=1 Tax=Streptomyces sp. NBC_00049 TaxID=2903617 RepID=A0AAU2JZL5_9ACTN